MKIALISCTKQKREYKCPARELYSESAWFREAYCYARLVADRIFILSAKYGLVPENMVIEPYNETLRYKKVEERREWGEMVLNELGKVSDLEHDEFIVLAGRFYYENLLPHLGHVKLPLGGVRQGGQIPELRRLIMNEMESNNAMVLHILFNGLPRFDWTMIDQIPYRNGIYVMFEKGECYHSMDRIVRIGTHRGQDRLLERLRDHFVREDADSSILRKNIGRAFLNMGLNPYLQVWEIDMHDSENKRNSGHLINKELDTKLEARISEYLRKNMTFICIPIDEEAERLRLEEGLIASLTMDPSFGPSSNWLGLNSPVPEIARSGLWNSQHLQGQPLSAAELERVKQLARSASERYTDNTRHGAAVRGAGNSASMPAESTGLQGKTTDDVRQYIEKLLQEAKLRGEDYIDLVSGDIHRQLEMKDRMPLICSTMYKEMMPGDIVLHTTASGQSSTIKIRYYLKNR